MPEKELVPNGDGVSASAVATPKTMFVDSLVPHELSENDIKEIQILVKLLIVQLKPGLMSLRSPE